MSKRKDAKTLVQWEHDTRPWATDIGRDLALDLYYDRDGAGRPYGVGVVLVAGEKVWAEVPVRFNLDWTPPLDGSGSPSSEPRKLGVAAAGSAMITHR